MYSIKSYFWFDSEVVVRRPLPRTLFKKAASKLLLLYRIFILLCHQTASDANLFDNQNTFHCNDYSVIGGIRTYLGVSDNPMFLWISLNSSPPNFCLFEATKQR